MSNIKKNFWTKKKDKNDPHSTRFVLTKRETTDEPVERTEDIIETGSSEDILQEIEKEILGELEQSDQQYTGTHYEEQVNLFYSSYEGTEESSNEQGTSKKGKEKHIRNLSLVQEEQELVLEPRPVTPVEQIQETVDESSPSTRGY